VCEGQHSGTASWFIQGNTFQGWKKDSFSSGLLDATIPDDVFQEIKNTETVMEVWAQLKVLI